MKTFKTKNGIENKKMCQKAMPPIDQRGVKTGHRSKYGFYNVKLIFSFGLGSAPFSKQSDVRPLKGALGAAQAAQGGALP